MENLLNDKEAAAFLEIAPEELRELIDHKVLPAYMIGGEFLRFKYEELEAIKELLEETVDNDSDERAFHQKFSKVKGFERFKEMLRANDIYFLVIGTIVLVLILYILSKHG